jgi:hypothetical protein
MDLQTLMKSGSFCFPAGRFITGSDDTVPALIAAAGRFRAGFLPPDFGALFSAAAFGFLVGAFGVAFNGFSVLASGVTRSVFLSCGLTGPFSIRQLIDIF